MNLKQTGVLFLGLVLLTGILCQQSVGYSSPNYANHPDDSMIEVEARLLSIEKKMSRLAYAYNKARQAIQIIAKKMQTLSVGSAGSAEMQELGNRISRIEAILEAMAQRTPSQNVTTDKETKALLLMLSSRMEKMEDEVTSISKRTLYASQNSKNGTVEVNPEVVTLMDGLERRMQRMELAMNTIAQKSQSAVSSSSNPQMEILMKETATRLAKLESVVQSLARRSISSSNASSSSVMDQEAMILLRAVSKKVDNLESNLNAPSISSSSSKIDVKALAKALREQGALASSGGGRSSAMDQEAMILLKTLSNKVEALESDIKNISVSSSGIDMKELAKALKQQGGLVASAPTAVQPSASIVGAVKNPGKIYFRKGGKRDLLGALAEVGGFTSKGDPTSVTVRRGPKVFTIDVTRIMQENLVSFDLEEGDIVVVKEKDGSVPAPKTREPMKKSAPEAKPRPSKKPVTKPSPVEKPQPKTWEQYRPTEESRSTTKPKNDFILETTPAPKQRTKPRFRSSPSVSFLPEKESKMEINREPSFNLRDTSSDQIEMDHLMNEETPASPSDDDSFYYETPTSLLREEECDPVLQTDPDAESLNSQFAKQNNGWNDEAFYKDPRNDLRY